MSSSSPRSSLVNPQMIGWFLGMIAAFAVIYFALPEKPLDGPGSGGSVSHSGDHATSSQCEGKLVKWIQSVDPERLQFNTDVESRVQELNRYWTSCGPTGSDLIVSDLVPIEAVVQGEYRERVLAPFFGRRDVEHIRQSLLLGRMATRIGESQKTDLDRVLAALIQISQQVEPDADILASTRPLTPFECLLLGQGTTSDRAWIFAEILRQLHLDAVVFNSEEAAVPPLVGVLIEQEVYLFDPLSGLPVPAAGESQRKTLFREPATLKAVLADDSILRQLDFEGAAFPWTAERLRAAKVGLVGSSTTWAPRLAELQFQWPLSQRCVIYDGLGASSDTKRGLVERVTEVLALFGYARERIQVWAYPEQQCALYDSLGAEAAPHMVPLVAMMSGPSTFEDVQDIQTGQWSVFVKRAKRSLQQARVQHLLGHRTEAIGGYLPMMRAHLSAPKQNQKIDAVIQIALDRNRQVADRATYWMASTQFENNDIDACVGTLKRYARDFPLGEMREAAAMRLAACLMKAQEPGAAAQLLEGIGPGPNQVRRRLLARRLLELSQSQPPAPATPPTGETPPPAAPSTPATPTSANESIPPPPPQPEASSN